MLRALLLAAWMSLAGFGSALASRVDDVIEMLTIPDAPPNDYLFATAGESLGFAAAPISADEPRLPVAAAAHLPLLPEHRSMDPQVTQVLIPLPAPVWTGLAGLGAAAAVGLRHKLLRRRAAWR